MSYKKYQEGYLQPHFVQGVVFNSNLIERIKEAVAQIDPENPSQAALNNAVKLADELASGVGMLKAYGDVLVTLKGIARDGDAYRFGNTY